MTNNFLFIDDSGSKDWETPYADDFVENPPIRDVQNLKFWRGNYFVLAGVHVSIETLASLNPKINKLKIEFFGTKHIEIKSVWLRNPQKRKKHYLDPYKISEDKLLNFTDKWYEIFEKNKKNVQLQAFILDKRFYKNPRQKFTPLQLLVQVLFDRIELHPSRKCTIVFDQMDSEIKSVKHRHGEILKISNKEIDLGSFQKKYSHDPPRFETSKNSNFLQLADTVAYNVYRQFVDYGDIWEDKNAKILKTYTFFDRITDNFYNQNGRIAGFGIVKVPSPNKVSWGRKTK
ncbi:hypothetical protein A2767_05990 [Candidatus Roizmanbacteria bacterium RIFCSPHIGHO2_01_FULL_35_10]|uniref:DUF3800 domain-containing protein n=1 Tax=Candidatus Roizmanbacteria bacterium RIFCSPLOWO2_01_FULL_35_13 TaxID=1802055 RepID=A0A1F7IG97_9BACT|nr:MAG: hypothetical protein A2767_05990 [Candidatus Roizmanbacteria bacterium RIFCSPHIGHO2_01_FULL_35_10]OGK42376.1 MAG: hypothetical protein A3A74_08045 [Candidatus Roizmanbacteria bacterium RIFCSPLOWO2_01_FULL_35_13]